MMDGVGTVGDPRLWLVYHYWWSKRRGRPMPAPGDISLRELPDAVQPNVMLLEVVTTEGGPRFRYVKVGSVFWRGGGRDPSGSFVDEVLPLTAGYRDYVVGIYEEMAVMRRPMYTENVFILSHGHSDPMATKRVSLPLSRDGKEVHLVLAGHVFDYGANGDDSLAMVTELKEGLRTFLE
jgi:hypothetical protein